MWKGGGVGEGGVLSFSIKLLQIIFDEIDILNLLWFLYVRYEIMIFVIFGGDISGCVGMRQTRCLHFLWFPKNEDIFKWSKLN